MYIFSIIGIEFAHLSHKDGSRNIDKSTDDPDCKCNDILHTSDSVEWELVRLLVFVMPASDLPL